MAKAWLCPCFFIGLRKPNRADPKGMYGFKQRTLAFTALGEYDKVVIKSTYQKAGGAVWFD